MDFIHNDVTSTRWPSYLGVLMYRRLRRNCFDRSYRVLRDNELLSRIPMDIIT